MPVCGPRGRPPKPAPALRGRLDTAAESTTPTPPTPRRCQDDANELQGSRQIALLQVERLALPRASSLVLNEEHPCEVGAMLVGGRGSQARAQRFAAPDR